MEKSLTRVWRRDAFHICALSACLLGLLWTTTVKPADHGAGPQRLFSTPLPNAPGKSLTAIVVNYAPGGKSPRHRHSGSVFAYVLSGSIRSESSATGPAKVYKTGEAFFEPPDSHHLVNENASSTEPARMLAIFIADTGAKLTTQ